VADAISFVRSDEQTMLGTTLAELLEAKVDFDVVRDMSTTSDAIDRPVWDGIAEMGLVGLHVPEEFGGAGYSMAEVAVVFEQLGRFVAAVPLLSSVMASSAILAGASDEQRRRILPSIAGGEAIATLAVYESAHPADVDGGGATLVSSGDGFVLNGSKRYVTDAPNADVFLVAASIDGVTAIAVVPSSADGVTVVPTNSLDPTRPLGEALFDGVLVDAGDVITDAGDALRSAIDAGVVCLAAEQVGGAQWCLETSVEYAKNRYQFGRAIGSFQAVKHRCADMLVAVEHARSVSWHAAASFGDPIESAVAVPLARSVCSDSFVQAAGDTIQILGGIGFTWEHEAHLYFKRAKADSLLFGSVESYRDRLADAVGF